MKKEGLVGILVALCMMVATSTSHAQHNVYVNKTVNGYQRTYIVNGVEKITYEPDQTTLWRGSTPTTCDPKAINLMSLEEKNFWIPKVLPERYLADFDFDVDFEEADGQRVKAEAEVTDESSPLYDDFVGHSQWSKTVNVVFNGSDVVVNGNIDSLQVETEGAHVTIRTAATGVRYILSGNSSNAGFKLYSERKAYLVLNGVDLTNPQGPVINSQLKRRLFIELAANTVNTLTDGSTYIKVEGEDQRGCLFAEGKICISGQGQLYVNGNKKCGIASDDYIHLIDGFVHVNAHAEKGKAVYGKDHVIIGGGVMRTFSDGNASKGIASDSLMTITGGLVKTITTGDALWEDEEEDYSSCCGIKSAYDMVISGCEIRCLSTGIAGKGISAGWLEITSDNKKKYHGTLDITDADLYVRTTGNRIPEKKEEDGRGHKVGVSSSPKCIKSVAKMTITSSNIYVRGSGGGAAEGLEAKKQIEINSGKIRSYCTDDAINCSGCVINDGDVLACSSENDGLDASYLKIFGGTLYAVGGWDQQMGIDTDGKTFEIKSGCEIIGMGSRTCTPHGTSTQPALCFYLKGKYVSGVALTDADNNIITQFPTPNTYPNIFPFISNDRLVVGNHYKIVSYKNSFDDAPVTEYDFILDQDFIMLGSSE